MKRNPLIIICLAALCGLASRPSEAPSPREGVRVLTSVFPLKEFAAAVAGDRGEARLLLPPGAGVHTWQPRAGDLVRLSRCDLFIYIGANLEPWLPDLLKGLGGKPVRTLEASSGLDLLASAPGEHGDEAEGREHGGHAAVDPHVWLDFGLDAIIVDRIRDELSALDPGGKDVYAANAGVLKARLESLDDRFRSRLETCPQKTIVLAGHAAFGYLVRRYGLEQIALYGLSPDSQPTPSGLISVVGIARDRGIKSIFFETAASPDLARTLAREIGARTLVLNPGHNLTREESRKGLSFFDIMEENLRSLEDGLGNSPKR